MNFCTHQKVIIDISHSLVTSHVYYSLMLMNIHTRLPFNFDDNNSISML